VFIVPGGLLILAAMFRAPKRDVSLEGVGRSVEAKQLAAQWIKLERALRHAGIDVTPARTLDEIIVDACAVLERSGRGDTAIQLRNTGRSISHVLYGGYPIEISDVKRITGDVSNIIQVVNSVSKVARGR
jgi:hypothetical protein